MLLACHPRAGPPRTREETANWGSKAAGINAKCIPPRAVNLPLLDLGSAKLTCRLRGRDIRLTAICGPVIRRILSEHNQIT